MKKFLFSVVLVVFTGLALAEEPIAKIIEIDGLVTIVDKDQLVNGSVDMPLFKGARVLSSSTGTALIRFNDGCKIRVKAVESFVVDESDCALLALKSGGAIPGMSLGNALLLGAGTVGVLSIINNNRSTALSGS